MFAVSNHFARDTILIRIEGYLRPHEMVVVAERLMRAVNAYRGMPFIVRADLRGMLVTSPEAAEILREAIEYAKCRGLVRWIWLLDSACVLLQVRRITGRWGHVLVDVVSQPEGAAVALNDAWDEVARIRELMQARTA